MLDMTFRPLATGHWYEIWNPGLPSHSESFQPARSTTKRHTHKSVYISICTYTYTYTYTCVCKNVYKILLHSACETYIYVYGIICIVTSIVYPPSSIVKHLSIIHPGIRDRESGVQQPMHTRGSSVSKRFIG